MPSLFSDPPFWLNALTALVAVAGVILALVRKDRKSVMIAVAGLLAMVLLFICDRVFESPREEGVRHVNEMAAAVDNGDGKAMEALLADDFKVPLAGGGSWTKAEFIDRFKSVKRFPEFKGVAVGNFDRRSYQRLDENLIRLEFNGSAKEMPATYSACTVEFKRTADGKWRASKLIISEPSKPGEPRSIPGLN